MKNAQQHAGNTGDDDAEPRRAAQICDTISAHCAHDEIAFEPDVDAAALLRQTFADTHKEERRAATDGAADHSNWHAPPAKHNCIVHRYLTRFREKLSRPYNGSLTRMMMNMIPSNTRMLASGKPCRR